MIRPLVAVAAALLIPFAFLLPSGWNVLPLGAGIVVCIMLCVAGYRLAFLTYAIACWAMASIALPFFHSLDSPLSSSFADASYIVAAIGIVVSLALRRQ
ncbi:MAG: hypothetical protein JO029_10360 [Candidatus Eremiobacteraeota bacterium]|nr:hypothetical protein [Candidatus Eremiobacteraeota bacterium]MBV8654600.1 hypothetical protein [Candidatus Eremiobacteraeota bacterium]